MARHKSQISVSDMIEMLSPPGEKGGYVLATIRAFCDESYDKDERIYALAGYLAHESQWKNLERKWNRRLAPLKEFGVTCFHAADCKSGFGDFTNVPKPQRDSLKIALTNMTAKRKLHAFCAAMFIKDYRSIANTSPLAAQVCAPKEYFWMFQMVIGSICVYIKKHKPNTKVIFMVDRQEEFSGRAKILYDDMRKNEPQYVDAMGPLAYGDKREFVPLQVADNLAYEAMKTVLNQHYDPTRPPRKAMGVLLPQVEAFKVLNEEALTRRLLQRLARGEK